MRRWATGLLVAGSVAVSAIAVVTPWAPSGGGSCTTTISSGLQTAVTNVAAGGTVCLNAGAYTFNTTISKASLTKITLAPGVSQASVTMNLIDVNSSNNLQFDGMTVGPGESEMGVTGGSAAATHIKFTNMRMTGHLCIWTAGAAHIDNIVDHLFMDSPSSGSCTGLESALGIYGSGTYTTDADVAVTNSEFFHIDGDAIDIVNHASGVTIGPGNWCHAIQNFGSGAHADCIQPLGVRDLTVTGNFIGGNGSDGNDGNYSDFDCGTDPNFVFTDNVVQWGNNSDQQPVYLSGVSGAVVTHNTFGLDTKHESITIAGGNPGCANSGLTVKDNVMQTGCASNATSSTFDYNVSSTSVCRGAHGLNGAATFTGGTTPSTLAGYQLTSGSLGHLAGSDGTDMGAPVATMTGAWP